MTAALSLPAPAAFAGPSAPDFDSLRSPSAQAAVSAIEVPPAPKAAAGADIADEIVSLYSAGTGFSPSELSRLRKLKVIFIPGFLSNINVNPSHVIADKGLILSDYFGAQVEYLRSLGVDCGVADIESEESVFHNAAIVGRAIKAAPGKVLLVGHSKGGLDSLETLLKDPAARAKVEGVITVQSPFYGSPIADLMLSNSVLSYSSGRILEMLGGSKKSMVHLSTGYRKDYHRERQAALASLLSKVPYLCVTTYIDDQFLNYDTVLEPFRDYMLALGRANDGLVPADSAVLPGSRYAVLGGADHLATVMSVPTQHFDRVRFLRALLKLQLR